MHGNKLIAYGFYEQRRHNGGVNAAGEGEEHLAGADLLTQKFYLLVNKSVRELGCGYSCHIVGSSVVVHKNLPSYSIEKLYQNERKRSIKKLHKYKKITG